MSYIDELCERRAVLKNVRIDIEKAFEYMRDCYKNGSKVLICGNGGSSADASHLTGELIKGFKKKRPIDDKFEEKLKESIEDYMDKNSLSDTRFLLREMKDNLEVGLPTIDITAFAGANTAYINDKDPRFVYANSTLALGKKGDVLLCITTSGNSENVVNAAFVAKAVGMKVIALTGFDGGKIKDIADVSIVVPINETYLIQEEHLAIYHAIALDIEEEFF